MKKINIKTKNHNCLILLKENSVLNSIKNEIKTNKKIFIIIDSKLSKLLNNKKIIKNTNIIKITGSEKIKSIDYFWKITEKLLKYKIDRSSTLIAIGGGTIGDLTGFVASTILRGIDFIMIPTTLLSQVDSSIGGKNGINSPYGKNLIGSYLQPRKVIIDPQLLLTLPLRELKSGYAEILKHALINDKIFYQWLDKNYYRIINLEKKFINKAIIESIKIKSKFIIKDEKEKLINSNSRAMLNFGHTFGHALELLNNYNNKLNHGEAISIGMALAAKISYKLKNISEFDYKNIIAHLNKVKLPFYSKQIKNNKMYNLMLSDKKNSNNKINLILLKKIGHAYFARGLDISKIKKLLN